MNLEIQDLRLLRALADAGSLAGAARLLGTNQGNLSRQLQRIERATRAVLFHRDHQGVVPTPAGQLLLHGADILLPRVDQLLAAASSHASDSPESRTVRLGSIPTPVLPTVAGQTCALLPDARLSLRTEECGRALLLMLSTGQLEAAVVRHFALLDQPLPEGVRTTVIATEQLMIGVAERHRLAGRRAVRLAELRSESCVLVDGHQHVELRDHFLAAVRHARVAPRISRAADEASAAALACASGGVFPAFPAPVPAPGVVFVPLADECARLRLLLAWTHTSCLAPYAGWLAECARAAYTHGHAQPEPTRLSPVREALPLVGKAVPVRRPAATAIPAARGRRRGAEAG